MKKNKIFKALTFIAIAVMLLAMFALPICADETTSSPQIQINPEFDANKTIRAIFNWLVSIIALIVIGVGGFNFVIGHTNNEPTQRNQGLITILVGLAAGGLILTVLNMVLL